MATIRQKPQRDDYSWEQHGQSSNNKFGVQLFKPGVNAEARKPSYKGTLTVFRPFPCLSYEDPNNGFEPYRIDPNGRNQFGPWIRRYDCAWNVGNNGQTFLLADPVVAGPGYDKFQSPLGVLYRAIEGACKKGHPRLGEWQPLREGGAGRGKKLSAPTEIYLMQGMILVHESKPQFGQGKKPIGWDPKGPTCFLMVTKALGQRILQLLDEENPGYRGDKSNFEARYVCGDPVSPESGRFIHIFQKGHDPRDRFNDTAASAGPVDLDSVTSDVAGLSRGGNDFDNTGYDAYIEKSYQNIPATLNKDSHKEMIRSKWLFWKDALWFPTYQEQAKILWGQFPKSACVFAWKDFNPTWITPEMWAEYKGAVQLSAPRGETVQFESAGSHASHPEETMDSDPFSTTMDPDPIGTQPTAEDLLGGDDTDEAAPEPLPDMAGLPSAASDPFAASPGGQPSMPADLPQGNPQTANEILQRFRNRAQTQPQQS